MAKLFFISHPEVLVEASVPVTSWRLSKVGAARAARFANSEALAAVTAIWSSTEVKAQQTARHLADFLDLPVHEDAQLGENDRSATGFLPPATFEAAADMFFAMPEASHKGWERAVDAQHRIVTTTRRIIKQHLGGDLAIVSHGAVGTLLYCALSQQSISRRYDQPGQGHYWVADLSDLVPRHGWVSID